MAVKHTPGPWRIEGSQIRAEDFVTLADLHEWINDTAAVREEAKANARLIAAAPELLEALRAVMAEYQDGYGLRCVEQVRAAIAKATGGEE